MTVTSLPFSLCYFRIVREVVGNERKFKEKEKGVIYEGDANLRGGGGRNDL